MSDLVPYIDNTNTIRFYVRDQISGVSLQSATVTFTLTDTDLTSVASGSMTFDSVQRKRNKDYYLFLGTLSHSLTYVENTPYLLNITLTYGSTQGKWSNIRVNPRVRDIRA